jgi:phage terminase large subunit-like protein
VEKTAVTWPAHAAARRAKLMNQGTWQKMRVTCLHAGWPASPPEAIGNELFAALRPSQAVALLYEWRFWARPNQLPPDGNWRVWLLLAGRGFGKTRTGAEMIRARAIARSARRFALVAPTAGDARDVMVEGESGILAISPPWERPRYEPSKRRLTWPNGAVGTLFSADEPERLRGPQHDAAWCDEIASWRYPEAWDMLMFGLRLGADPRVVVTTTPRSSRLLKELVADPAVVVTRGTTYENRTNLAPGFLRQIIRKYQGTRLGRQELDAELLEDVPGALWNRSIIEATRARTAPVLTRIVVAIDPAASSTDEADETGIVVAGKDSDGHGWVLADASGRHQPTEWAKTAISAYRSHSADRIVAEVNNGGEMVEATLRMIEPNLPFAAVRASRGKVTRAEPVAALYEQGRVHHVGMFPQLEDQMCAFTANERSNIKARWASRSPDRVDALVWAFTDLLVEPMRGQGIYEAYRQRSTQLPDANGGKGCS